VLNAFLRISVNLCLYRVFYAKLSEGGIPIMAENPLFKPIIGSDLSLLPAFLPSLRNAAKQHDNTTAPVRPQGGDLKVRFPTLG
jgi:hypothetical protein